MKKHELVDSIRALEIQLNIREVQDKLISNPKFILIRTEVRLLRRKLEFDNLINLAEQMDALSDELVAGIQEIQKDLKSLTNIKQTIDNLTSFLGVVARVISLS